MFPDGKTDVTLKERETKLAAARAQVQKLIYRDLATDGYYTKNPHLRRWTYFGIAIAVGFLGHMVGVLGITLTGRPIVYISMMVCAALFIIFAPFMTKRTQKGTEAYEHAKGFKEYLETAERYRMQWQEEKVV